MTTWPVAGLLGVNPVTDRLYVSNPAMDSVSVVNSVTGEVISTLPVGDSPGRPAVNVQTNRIYVISYFDATLAVIDGTAGSVVETVSVGGPNCRACDVAVDAPANEVYVTTKTSSSVHSTLAVVDGDTNSLVGNISLSKEHSNVCDVAFDEVVQVAYVPGQWNGFFVFAKDGDDDGCTGVREVRAAPVAGGGRNPTSFWDFFDTPDANADPQRNRVINIVDLARIVNRFGAAGTPGDPLTTPPAAPAYHAAFDRSFAGPDPWDTGPPNGAITVQDINLLVRQFGHSCLL